MAEASAALHHNDVELAYLKQALDADPKSIEVNRHCARSLGRMGQFDQAIACWHRIETLRGKDDEASQMISSLAQQKLMRPQGPPATSHKKQTPVVEVQAEEVQENYVALTPRQRLEQAIAQDPQNLGNYVELAQLLLESNQLTAAEGVLNRAITACGETSSLLEQLERVHYLRAEELRILAEQHELKQEMESGTIRIPWLELILGSAFVLLIIQIVPSAKTIAIKLIDVRQWSRAGWFLFNVAILLGLVALRFRTEIHTYIQRRRIRRISRAAESNTPSAL